MLKMDDFWEHGKSIALLFGEKWSFLDIFSSELHGKMLKMDEGKWQAYSLTFW